MPQTVNMRYVPNALTIGRILLTPLVLVLLMTPTLMAQAGALALFIAASVTDWLDGQLARQMKAHSRLGTFLDPLADKILVLGTFIILAIKYPHVAPWWAVGLIAGRDVVVTGLRVWAQSQNRVIRTLPIAKAKTASQLIYLIGMLAVLAAAHLPGQVGAAALWVRDVSVIPLLVLYVVVFLTLLTGGTYLYRLFKPETSSHTPTR